MDYFDIMVKVEWSLEAAIDYQFDKWRIFDALVNVENSLVRTVNQIKSPYN